METTILDTILVLFDVFMVGCGFCILFNFRKKQHIVFASLGGVLSWFVYLCTAMVGSVIFRNFLASIALTVYSEIMARRFKAPVTGFLLISIIPLVPGGGIYYTMEYCIRGDTANFLETGLNTFGIAGAIAVGVLLVSSAVRLWYTIQQSRPSTGQSAGS